eukprot:XP_002523989.2 aspartic proteinase CDR1 [Ricinus communis]
MHMMILKYTTMTVVVTFHTLLFFALLIILSIATLSAFAHVKADNFGFTAELIRRDSPNSPFYNALEAAATRSTNASQHYDAQIGRFNLMSDSYYASQSELNFSKGNYLIKISVGTPPAEILALADITGDLTWLPCKTCQDCTKDGFTFFPSESSTYTSAACESYQCQITNGAVCQTKMCIYLCGPLPQQRSSCTNKGLVAMDTISFHSSSGQALSYPNTNFICGTFIDNWHYIGAGIVGLGRGLFSMTSQMKHLINGTFSQCLVPYSSKQSSKINFGLKGVVSGEGVVSTPIADDGESGAYFLFLEAMSVGGNRVANNFYSAPKSNIYIDWRTTFTSLPHDFYENVEAEVRKAINLTPINYNNERKLSLCYKSESDHDFDAPPITMHFTNADVQLSPLNTFVRMDWNVVCFAFLDGTFNATKRITHAVYGSWQQMNFIVGYDLKSSTVSFKQADCTLY